MGESISARQPNGYPRITPSSPLRDLGPDTNTMDYERCAALHNELLAQVEAFAPPDQVAQLLYPSVIQFLKRAWNGNVKPKEACLLFYIGALNPPRRLIDGAGFTHWPGRFIKLYESSHFRTADDEGLIFDQHTLKATWIEDYNDTQIIAEHDCSRERELDCAIFVSPWLIHQFTTTDLERTITAFKRLVHAIESRMEQANNERKAATAPTMNLPWHDPSIFNQDIIPPSSFAHEFLSATSQIKVRCRYIAPGIRFPTAAGFLDQPVTDSENSRHIHLGQFPGDCPLHTDAEGLSKKHWVQDPIYKRTDLRPGFYIYRVMVKSPSLFSNECRLFLPSSIGLRSWAKIRANPMPKGRDRNGDLYQVGISNGITNRCRIRIHVVLNNWTERVEGGDWGADADGVMGGIGKFKEADTEEHWGELLDCAISVGGYHLLHR
ncbi:hypothetical protein BDW69DRAFT_193990 [Aspergillus filifer]